MKEADGFETASVSGNIKVLTETEIKDGFAEGDLIRDDEVNGQFNRFEKLMFSHNNELKTILTSAGISPNQNLTDQVKTALDALYQPLGSSGYAKGYINGGVASNNATTPDSIVDITALEARSSDNTTDISLSADSLDITDDASWARGLVGGYLLPTMISNIQGDWDLSNSSNFTGNTNYFTASDRDNSTILNSIPKSGSEELIFENTSGEVEVSAFGVKGFSSSFYITGFSWDYWDGSAWQTGGVFTGQTITDSYAVLSITPTTTSKIRVNGFTTNSVNLDIRDFDLLNSFGGVENATIHTWATETAFKLDDATGSNITGAKRRVGAFITDSSGDIVPFTNEETSGGGLDCYYSSILDYSDNTENTSFVDVSLSVPSGISLKALVNIAKSVNDSGTDSIVTVQTEIVDDMTICVLGTTNVTPTGNFSGYIPTNNATMSYKHSTANGTLKLFEIRTLGFADERIA